MDRISASSHSLQYCSFPVFIQPCTIIHSACSDTNQGENNELPASHECCDAESSTIIKLRTPVYEFHTFCVGKFSVVTASKRSLQHSATCPMCLKCLQRRSITMIVAIYLFLTCERCDISCKYCSVLWNSFYRLVQRMFHCVFRPK